MTNIKKQAKSNASDERAMRDRMNGIQRDASGKMTHIHGKPMAQIAKEAEID